MICEVCYHVCDDIFSVNMLEAEEFQTCRTEAHAHAKKFGYELVSVKEIPDWKVAENKSKRMPLVKLSKNN